MSRVLLILCACALLPAVGRAVEPVAPGEDKPVAQPTELPPALPPDSTRDPLDRLLEPQRPPTAPQSGEPAPSIAQIVFDPPLGYAGPSGVYPRSGSNNEFMTVEDRWRIGYPAWDRYGLGHPRVFDYPYRLGNLFDPY